MSIKVGNILSILLVVMCVTGLSVAAPPTLEPLEKQQRLQILQKVGTWRQISVLTLWQNGGT